MQIVIPEPLCWLESALRSRHNTARTRSSAANACSGTSSASYELGVTNSETTRSNAARRYGLLRIATWGSVPAGSPRYGWQRVARVDALEPGDVVAWIKPKEIQSPNTGHVGFVVLPPARVPGYENAYLIRFADSTRLLHDDDTRQGRNGFGKGTILLVSDPETGAPIAYGWRGLKWRSFETKIALGRPLE